MKPYDLYDRVLGCLVTAGMGDAIGAPAEAMSRAEIQEKYGGRIETFVDGSDNEYALGNEIAEVTDDASQMYEMAKAVVSTGGDLTIDAAAAAIIRWSQSYPKYYPRNAGPTTSHVIGELLAGKDPVQTGKVGLVYGRGTSNGAAMRVAGAGLAHPGDYEKAIETAVTMCMPSHGTQHAYAGACAIACGISEAMTQEADVYSTLSACLYGARRGEQIGLQTARIATGANVEQCILRAIGAALEATDMPDAERRIERAVGNDGSIQSSVSAACGLFAAANADPAATILGGANIGGDTDTIACIAGMLSGALRGFSALPAKWPPVFCRANPSLDFEGLARAFTEMIRARNLSKKDV